MRFSEKNIRIYFGGGGREIMVESNKKNSTFELISLLTKVVHA